MFSDVPPQDGPQPAALAIFTLLSHLRRDWGGALIVSCGLGPLGSAVTLAANIAGAACLAIEPDPTVSRTAMRIGACDFFVKTVDEALRVLKNEIRQHKPLSVALECDRLIALNELRERGLHPQLFTTASAPASGTGDSALLKAARSFQLHGTPILDLDGQLQSLPNALDASAQWQFLLGNQGLERRVTEVETAAALRLLDLKLQQLIPAGDPRRPWFTAAPRLFHRDRPYRRAMLLTPQEFASLDRATWLERP